MDNYKVSNYDIVRRLGSGAFGEIFQGVDTKTNQEVAIKFENVNASLIMLSIEARVIQHLQKDQSAPEKGIPRFYYYGTEGDHNVMVTELLGPNLQELFNLCNRKFSLKTVLMLGIQMLSRIEFLHSKAFLHRDIKPENFVVGHGINKHRVYVIDFGFAKKYYRGGKHIPLIGGKSPRGTAIYVSVNTQSGLEQGRRDDLESLGFVLIYFLRGGLPWQNMKVDNKIENQKLLEKKLGTPFEILCEGFPNEFVTYLSYCRNLKFEDKPDYNYLQNLFQDLFTKSGFENDDMYDWDVLAKKENDDKKEIKTEENKLADVNEPTNSKPDDKANSPKKEDQPEGRLEKLQKVDQDKKDKESKILPDEGEELQEMTIYKEPQDAMKQKTKNKRKADKIEGVENNVEDGEKEIQQKKGQVLKRLKKTSSEEIEDK